ncbi:MAG TPA: hypothetical protein DGG95_00900 [Cytophagales bacterium]|nr:hypothetical protein [Cytophagales bacterium]
MVGGGFDLLKTDNHKLLNKAQLGLEANYFVVRHVGLTVGTELWTTNQKSSFVMGARWYANDNVFARFRGLIGANDATFGAGYSKAMDSNLRFEGIGDYYIGAGAFAIRIGVSYVLK